jgi:dihydroorotase
LVLGIRIEGRIINHDNDLYGQVEINDETGLIESVGRSPRTPDIRLKEDELLFPGFVDIHVHSRDDASGKQRYKEGFRTVSEAAINGGVVRIADMPNNPIPPIDDDSYGEKTALTSSSLVPVTLYAGIGPDTLPLGIEVPYKAFMGPSVGDLFFVSQEQLEEAINRYAGKGVSFHCEDPEILDANKGALAHELKRPAEAEVSAIGFALELIGRYGLIGKICHCSTGEGLERIRRAKSECYSVTCEATPHHLYFDHDMLKDDNRLWLQMNPPIRSPEDRMAMIEGLKKGDVDYLATDHAPHAIEEKMNGISGVPNLDTYTAFITWLMKEHGLEPQDIARICSYNPGLFVNEFGDERYGRIEEGYVGSLTVVDLSAPSKVSRSSLKTKCNWSPFENVIFPGNASHTIVRGKVYSR